MRDALVLKTASMSISRHFKHFCNFPGDITENITLDTLPRTHAMHKSLFNPFPGTFPTFLIVVMMSNVVFNGINIMLVFLEVIGRKF